MRHVALLLAFVLFMGLQTAYQPTHAESGAPVSGQTIGDWVIESGDDLLYEGETVVVNGDLIIENGGVLRLHEMRIEMRGKGDNELAAVLRVEEGGTLLAINTTITTYRNGTGGPNDPTEYKFEVYGTMVLENCTVSKMWGSYDGIVVGPITDTHTDVLGGIQVYSDDVQILNSMISESLSSGLYIVDSSPVIINCTLSDNNGAGIWAGSRDLHQPENARPFILNNTFQGNVNGMWFYYASATVLDNTVHSGGRGVVISSGSNETWVERATTFDMQMGLSFWVSAPTVRECLVFNSQWADIELINTATPTVINTAFNRSKVSFQTDESLLTVKNALKVRVVDPEYNPIYNADVEVNNLLGDEVWRGTTDQYGELGPEVLEAYQQNRTLFWNFTPHMVSVLKEGYDTSEEVELFSPTIVTLVLEIQGSDFTSPEISDLTPEHGSVVKDPEPLIKASYYDSSGIDQSSVILTLDGNEVSDAVVTSTEVRYTPSTKLQEGVHTVKVEVADASENHNLAEVTWDFTVNTSVSDQSPPIISNLKPAPGSVVNTLTPKIGADFEDDSGVDVDGVVIILDDGDVTSLASITPEHVEFVPSSLGSGNHVVELKVPDGSISRNVAEVTWNFSLDPKLFDFLPPNIYDTEPANGSVISSLLPTIKAAYEDDSGIDLDSVTLKLDGTDVSSKSQISESEVIFTPSYDLDVGIHTVDLLVEDASPNHNIAQLSWSFTLDPTADDHEPPDITGYEWLDSAVISDPRPEIILSISDTSGIDLNSLILELDGREVTGDAEISVSTITYIPNEKLAPGEHTFRVCIRDASYNKNERIVSWSFTVLEEKEEENFIIWIIVAVIGAVLLAVIIVTVLWQMRLKRR